MSSNSTRNSTVTENSDIEARKEGLEDEEETKYPAVLESAPFPALATVDEISHTISRIKSNQSGKEIPPPAAATPFKQEPYPTEGIRNPGWLSVASNFLVNFFVFGTTFAWGNYQSLYLNTIYAGQTSLLKISFAGTTASALLLAAGLITTPIIQRIGFRYTMLIGTILSPLALVLVSFATQLWHIYLAQGVLLGIGGGFVFSASITLPAQWFTKRRSLATGIAVSGSGIGGLCISPMIQRLFQTVGYRNTLRVQGCFGFVILCIATALAMSRYRPPNNNSKGKGLQLFDRNLFSVRYFLLLSFAFFVPFGYIAPFFLAPEFARSIGLSASVGAIMVSIMSAGNAVCRIGLGYLADKFGRVNTMFAFTLLAGIFTMVIWQVAKDYATFAVFCVLYGLTSGGFVSLLPTTTADVVGVENIQKGLGIAYLTTVIGSLLGTPLLGLLYSTYGWTAAIQFSGSVTIVGALFLLALRLLMSRKLFIKI